MNSEFIHAVRRIVERGHPPKLRSSSPGASQHPTALEPGSRPSVVCGVAVQERLNETALLVTWKAVPGASGYELQTNPDPSRLMRWFVRGRVPRPSAQINLSNRATRLWVRVRAFGLAGPGPWSDPLLLHKIEGVGRKAA